jgi:hypothetical protein
VTRRSDEAWNASNTSDEAWSALRELTEIVRQSAILSNCTDELNEMVKKSLPFSLYCTALRRAVAELYLHVESYK